MKLYTSYYYQIRNFLPNLVGLSTARWPPKYIPLGKIDKRDVLCINCPPFVPNKACENLCEGNCKERSLNCKFLQTYYNQLQRIDYNQLIDHLTSLDELIKMKKNIKEEVNFAFLVYESPRAQCSERYVIQRYVHEHGYQVIEWSLDASLVG